VDEDELHRLWRKSIEDDINDLAGKVRDLDDLLHGDRAERDSGMVGQLNAIENKINSVLSILHPDSTGHGGLLHEHNEVKRKVFGKERDLTAWLVFWAKVIGVIGSIAVVAVSSWPTLSAYWKQTGKDMTTLNRKINKANHPRIPRYKPKPIETPEEGDVKE